MPAGPSPTQAAQAIQSAAAQYGVPAKILVGVYGTESSFGTAYANGGTTYGFFGLTSPGLWSPSDSFQDDADIAARTLAGLYKQTGDWNGALNMYNSGRVGSGYGLAQIEQMADTAPEPLRAILSASAGATPTPGGSTGSSAPGGSGGGSGASGGILAGLGSIAGVPVEYVLLGVGGVLVLVLAMWAGGVTI